MRVLEFHAVYFGCRAVEISVSDEDLTSSTVNLTYPVMTKHTSCTA